MSGCTRHGADCLWLNLSDVAYDQASRLDRQSHRFDGWCQGGASTCQLVVGTSFGRGVALTGAAVEPNICPMVKADIPKPAATKAVRRKLPERERFLVWVRAGGCCELCGRYLLEGDLTGRADRLGELAHIVGQSTGKKSPPRPSQPPGGQAGSRREPDAAVRRRPRPDRPPMGRST